MSLLLALWPFYVSDLLLLAAQEDAVSVYAIYWGTSATVLMAVLILAVMNRLDRRTLLLEVPKKSGCLLASVGLTIACVLINQALKYWEASLGNTGFGFVNPPYPSHAWKWTDLTLGLGSAALTEELVFRGALVSSLSRRMSARWAVVCSVLAFGLIHWGQGLAHVISTCVWAILPAWFVLRYRSIYPAIVAHYVTNVVAFSAMFELRAS